MVKFFASPSLEDEMDFKDWAELKTLLENPPVTLHDMRVAIIALIRAEMERELAKTE